MHQGDRAETMHACALKARKSKDGRKEVTPSKVRSRKKINVFNPEMLLCGN